MIRYICKILIMIISLSALGEAAFVYAQESNERIFEVLGEKDHRVTIPFELINNLIVVEVHVNNSGTMKFILDSGASSNIITSLHKKELSLNNVNSVRLAGLGDGNTIPAFQSLDNMVKVGSRIQGRDVEILLLQEDVFDLSSFMGTEVHGILGHDFFESFAVEINYHRKLMRIYNTDAFEKKFRELPIHRKWHTIPIELQESKSYTYIDYKHSKNHDPATLRLLLDTGASNSFSLYKTMDERIKIPSVTISSIIGTGLSGKVTGETGRVEAMRMGEFEFPQPVIAYPDSESVRRVVKTENRMGSIGGDIFRRFKIIFHYDNRLLYLRKNRNFKDDFYFNSSGIEVHTPVPNLPYYVVGYVREGSPAFIADVQEGDVLKEINGVNTIQLSLTDLIEYFQGKREKTIQMRVERDSVFKDLTFEMDTKLIPDS